MPGPCEGDALLTRFLNGPVLLEDALAGLADVDLDAPPPGGGWTNRQIVHHIVDGDDLWKTGIKVALGGNEHAEYSLDWYRTQPQDVWAVQWAYATRAVEVSLALLAAIRQHIAQLLVELPDGWGRCVAVRRPDGGTERVSVAAIVAMQADHLERHVQRIRAIRAGLGGGQLR